MVRISALLICLLLSACQKQDQNQSVSEPSKPEPILKAQPDPVLPKPKVQPPHSPIPEAAPVKKTAATTGLIPVETSEPQALMTSGTNTLKLATRNQITLTQADLIQVVSELKTQLQLREFKDQVPLALEQYLRSIPSENLLYTFNHFLPLLPLGREHLGLRPYTPLDLLSQVSSDSASDTLFLPVFQMATHPLKDDLYQHLRHRYNQNYGYNHELWRRVLSEHRERQ